jgi:hypothetical protein
MGVKTCKLLTNVVEKGHNHLLPRPRPQEGMNIGSITKDFGER